MKRIPPWALVAGAVALGALFWLWKKRREQAAKETTESEQQSASEAPVVPEEGEGAYPYSIGGAYGGGGGAIGNAAESQSQLSEIFKNQGSYLQQEQQQQSEFESTLARQLRENNENLQAYVNSQRTSTTSAVSQGSGGGAPEEPRRGTTAAPATPGATCGHGKFGEYPLGSAPNCYRISREKSGAGCPCHAHYGSNQLDCAVGSARNHTCHF